MPLRYKQRILDHLTHRSYEPSTADAIASDLRVEDDFYDEFMEAIEQLRAADKIEVTDKGFVQLPEYGDELVGIIRVNPRGFGFLITEDKYRGGDLFIPPGNVGDAISGDRVRVKVFREGKRERGKSGYVGRVVEVVERGHDKFAGTLKHEQGKWYVEPDGRVLKAPVIIRDPHAKNAKEGDKVVFELLQYPEDDTLGAGVITEVLGEAGKPDVETAAVIAAHGLHTSFTDEVISEARDSARTFERDMQTVDEDREHLRDQFIFTIDPPDAKDFDDAISIAYDEKAGEWTLGVHIADVAHFVRAGSPLDEEARERGNSVYLPRLVLPMLPETLSNGVCSLQEGEPRFTKSAFMTLDKRGRVMHQRLASTIIKSAKRLTYLEAQALIDGDKKEARKHARTDTDYSDQLIDALRMSDRLARTLRQRRMDDGMIVLNLPEVELIFDDDGHVIDAVPEDDAFTHTIIEMFMVEANEAVARTFSSLGVPLIRRIHPEPSYGDMEELAMYARTVQMRLPDEPSRSDMQRLLNATHDTPAARAIHFAVLKTLAKATYSPAIIGHFALASDHYTHFTSPIRRYPDLTVHRVIEAFLDLTDNGRKVPGGKKRRSLGRRLADDDRVLDEAQLIDLGHHCSQTEVDATAAERELRDFLVMQFLHEHHLGDEFTGIVTGVMSKGVFVSLERFLVEGMVSMTDLPNPGGKADRWVSHPQTGRLVAQRSGASVGIGDVVTVQIVRIDLASRHMDLMMTKMPARMAATADVDTEKGGKSGKGSKRGGRSRGGGGGGKAKSSAKRRRR